MSSSSKTIIYVSQTFSPTSGWGRVAHQLATQAELRGWTVIRIAADNTGSPGMPRCFGMYDPIARKFLRTLHWAVWIRHFPDAVVHIVTEPQFLLATFIPGRAIGTLHGTYARLSAHGSGVMRWLFQHGLTALGSITAVSRYTASQAPAELVSRIRFIPNAIDQRMLEGLARAQTWSRDRAHRFLCVGALKSRKGILELIRGFAQFAEQDPEAVLAIVGTRSDEVYAREVEAEIASLDLSLRVRLVGTVSEEDLAGWYEWCTAFALTPIESEGAFEGFGLVYLEANAYGKPVLGVSIGGAAEAISEHTGVRASSVEPKEIAQSLHALVSKKDWQFAPWLAEHALPVIFSLYEEEYEKNLKKQANTSGSKWHHIATTIVLAAIIFATSLGVYSYPFLKKGFVPGPGYPYLSVARNLAFGNTLKTESSNGVLLSSAHAATEGATQGVLNPLTSLIYARIFRVMGKTSSTLVFPFYLSIVLAAFYNTVLFLLITRLISRSVGFMAALLAVLMPVRIMGALFYGGYEFAMFFFILALYTYLGSRKGPFEAGLVRIFCMSILLALAALSRNAFFISALPIFGMDLWKHRSIRRGLCLLLPFFLLFGSTLTPFSWLGVPNGYVTGTEQTSFSGTLGEVFPDPYTAFYRRDAFLTELRQAELTRGSTHFLHQWGYDVSWRDHVRAYVDSLRFYLKEGINLTNYGGPLIIGLMLLGASALYRQKKELFWFFGLWLALWISAMVYVQTGDWDHFLEIYLVVIVCLGLGIKEVLEMFKARGVFKIFPAGIVLALLCLHLIYADKWRLFDAYRSSQGVRDGVQAAASVLETDGEADVVAVGVHPSFADQIYYLTDRDVVYFSPETVATLIKNGDLSHALSVYRVKTVVGFSKEASEALRKETAIRVISLPSTSEL
jgi:glycosyltransferase involved in cell wall biosynthesis